MRALSWYTTCCLTALLVLLSACGGGGSQARPGVSPTPMVSPTPSPTLSPSPTPVVVLPSPPRALVAHVGDRAISLGWQVPADAGSSAILGYEVATTPPSSASDIVLAGTRALIRGLANDTPYAVTVRAVSTAGLGAAASVSELTPSSADPAHYQSLTIDGDDSVSGVFDPALLHSDDGGLWLAYSSVHYYNDEDDHLVQDVGIRLAHSSDGGATFQYQHTIASPAEATVTDTDPALSACGSERCAGRWVYETAWLIDDSQDPDPARRFKLFAHKYFLNPGRSPATLYHLGAIVMWTAASPAADWSEEQSLLGWFLTPPELQPRHRLADIDSQLADCLVAGEGSALVRSGTIDLVLTCPHEVGDTVVQALVLLRSDNHLQDVDYVAHVLTPTDAGPLGADYYSAPALAASASAPLLIVTPVFAGLYAGCAVFPVADIEAGHVFRSEGLPLATYYSPTLDEHFGGACAYDAHGNAAGQLISDLLPGATPVANKFRIYRTGATLLLE